MPYRRKFNKRRKYGMRRRRYSSKKRVASKAKRFARVRRTKRRTTLTRKVARISKDVRTMKLFDQASLGHKIYCHYDSGAFTNNVNSFGVAQWAFNTYGDIDSCLANLRVYNGATNNWDVVAGSGDTTGVKTRFLFSSSNILELKNNWACDMYVEIYLCTVRGDTAYLPNSLYQDDIRDISFVPTLSANSIMYTPQFAPGLRKSYRVKRVRAKILRPGQMFLVTHKTKKWVYCPGDHQTNDDQYSKRYKSAVWWVRFRGELQHQSADVTKAGYTAGQVDMSFSERYHVYYDAGRSITYQVDNNTLDSLGVQAQGKSFPAHSSCVVNLS